MELPSPQGFVFVFFFCLPYHRTGRIQVKGSNVKHIDVDLSGTERRKEKSLFASNLDSHGLYMNLIASKMHIETNWQLKLCIQNNLKFSKMGLTVKLGFNLTNQTESSLGSLLGALGMALAQQEQILVSHEQT